jgi:hypothetical protein
MTPVWTRFNSVMLVLVLLALVAIIAMLATGVRGGPLDPVSPPGSTDSVRLPGTPISGPTTITAPGHYYLTRDVSVTGAQNGITISASRVSLDLGGFTVDGDKTVGTFGIFVGNVAPVANVTITNGTVQDFHIGVDSAATPWVEISGVRAIGNIRGFHLGGTSLLHDCLSDSNQEAGIHIAGSNNVVRECQSFGPGGHGLSVAGGNNLVERSLLGTIHDVGFDTNFRENIVLGNFVLTANGGAKLLDNICGNPVTNPAGNIVGTADHANVGC